MTTTYDKPTLHNIGNSWQVKKAIICYQTKFKTSNQLSETANQFFFVINVFCKQTKIASCVQ